MIVNLVFDYFDNKLYLLRIFNYYFNDLMINLCFLLSHDKSENILYFQELKL